MFKTLFEAYFKNKIEAAQKAAASGEDTLARAEALLIGLGQEIMLSDLLARNFETVDVHPMFEDLDRRLTELIEQGGRGQTEAFRRREQLRRVGYGATARQTELLQANARAKVQQVKITQCQDSPSSPPVISPDSLPPLPAGAVGLINRVGDGSVSLNLAVPIDDPRPFKASPERPFEAISPPGGSAERDLLRHAFARERALGRRTPHGVDADAVGVESSLRALLAADGRGRSQGLRRHAPSLESLEGLRRSRRLQLGQALDHSDSERLYQHARPALSGRTVQARQHPVQGAAVKSVHWRTRVDKRIEALFSSEAGMTDRRDIPLCTGRTIPPGGIGARRRVGTRTRRCPHGDEHGLRVCGRRAHRHEGQGTAA